MFSEEVLEGVEIASSWKEERSVSDSSTQTKGLKFKNVALQSYKQSDEQTQTIETAVSNVCIEKDDTPALASFLKRIEPILYKELDKVNRSQAFDGYEVSWEEKTSAVSCIHMLTHAPLNNQVTGLSWNSTGAVIAVAYGRYDHEDWCTHRSAVCTWNLDRQSLDRKKADTSIDQLCCIMCVAFHPKNPAWLAAGNFNGEVLLWDLSQESDLLLASSSIGDSSHREPVTNLQWVAEGDIKQKHKLVSVSGDGKTLVWTVNSNSKKLALVDGFLLTAECLPKQLRAKGGRGDQEVGITCLSFNHEDSDMFFVGSESGAVFKCSLHSQVAASGSNTRSSLPLRSPVTFVFAPHHGPVYSVDCSPYHRNAFLTSAMDQSLRIYNALQAQPILTIEPGEGYLLSAAWSPTRPLVAAAGTETGLLLLFDLSQDKPVPVHKLEASIKKAPVYVLQFSKQRRHLLATGDGNGWVHIFHLSDDLTTQNTQELEMLSAIVNTASSD